MKNNLSFQVVNVRRAMLIIYQLLRFLEHILNKESRIVKWVKLILQNVFGALFVKIYVIQITILGDNYINFQTEKQDLIELGVVFLILGALSYLHKSFSEENRINNSIIAGITASFIIDLKTFLVFL